MTKTELLEIAIAKNLAAYRDSDDADTTELTDDQIAKLLRQGK